jgi:hypothetical protein
MGSPTRYACCEKEMLGWIREKMVIQESAPGGGRFSTSSSTTTKNGASAYSALCVLGENFSTTVENGSWENAHTSDPSSRGERLGGKPSTLVQCAQCTGGSSNC